MFERLKFPNLILVVPSAEKEQCFHGELFQKLDGPACHLHIDVHDFSQLLPVQGGEQRGLGPRGGHRAGGGQAPRLSSS